jgi:DNA repair protein RadA/Sms
MLSMAQTGLTLLFGIYYASRGEITTGDVLTFVSYISMLIWPIRQLGRILQDLGKSIVAMKRIYEVLDAPAERDTPGATEAPLYADIEFKHVRFSYDDQPVLRDVSFCVKAGKTVALLGATGIGKSTLLLQVCDHLAKSGKRTLYISGEESARQIKLRANRLGITSDLYVLAENALDAVEEKIRELQPDTAVIDSIQTMYRPEMTSAPGSVSQIREGTSLIMRLCKETGTSVFLVGHVTKDGAIAGPRMLEHMVDVVLYFEGDRQQDYRLLRAVKNRFGSVNELGVFRMTGQGMQVVDNPSEELLSHRAKGASGSTVFCGMEGSRPLLCDVQALTSPTFYGTPRRSVNGADSGRVAMLLAVLEKRAHMQTYNQDVYINVAGGLELSEPAADLALCAAVASSLRDKAVGPEVAVMGEVGLAGEVRTVPQCERRITECARLGFTTIIVPRACAKRVPRQEGVNVVGVDTVAQALSVIF